VAEQLGRERYVPVFYPGESDFAKAVPVDLASGESRLNVNIVLRAEQGRHIRGSVVDVLGKPVFGAHVWAIPEGGSFGEVAVSRRLCHAERWVGGSGRFGFGTFATRGLPAGTYTLKALGAVAGSADGSEPNHRGLMRLSQMGVEAGRDLAYGSARVTV